MPKVSGTNLTVEGYEAGKLVTQLEFYCSRTRAAQLHLLNAARVNNLKIVLSESGDKCGFNKKTGVVEISWDACSATDKKGNASTLNCLAESALFELQNGISNPAFEQAKGELKAQQITILQFGLRFALAESESTIVTAKIIRQVQRAPHPPRYVPSRWGDKQVAAYFENSGDFANYFADQPHEREEAGIKHLKTKYRYAYETKGLREDTFRKITTADVAPSGGHPNWYEVWDALNEFQPRNGLTDHQTLFYYVLALNRLQREGWTVLWNEETPNDWVDYADDLTLNRVEVRKVQTLNDLAKRLAGPA